MRARRLRRALAALLAVAGLFVPFIVGVPTAYDGEPVFVAIPVEHVNTLIGTGTGAAIVGEINNFPGASVPFGMVQYSPDTVDNYAGYDYDNPHSTGFSMTHASVGCPAFGDISMLPTTTPLGSQPWSAWEEIAHDDTEVGVPGYYTVRFPGTGVIAELTATTRTGVGRFRYPRNGWPALFHVRSGASLAGNYAATLQIEDNTTITGSATSGGFCGKKNLYTVYFAMKFSQPFSSYGTWDGYAVYPGSHSMNSSYSGGYVGFPAGSVLEVRTALSYVSVDGARANLDAEGGASFDDIRAATSSEWNAALSRIAVAGRGPGDVDTFYTCLYRSLLHPNTFNDVDGRYIGFDGVIHSVASGHTHYANFSDWDTYRSLAPLQGLLFPQRASDMIQSLVTDAEQSGAYPRWALANSATGMMSGDSVVPLIVNLYAFGARDFDLKSALHYMVNAATQGGVGLDGFLERPGIAAYLRLGYGPQTAEFRANGRIAGASVTLEWSVDDFAISRFADSLGDTATAAVFQNRSQYWQNLFNPTKLNVGPNEPYLWAGNEPGFGVPWLYNYIGQPWKTQRTVDRVRGLFGPTPGGAPGNDDLGALSSWYVWAALGLYPSTPGTTILTVNTPLFDRAVIALPTGKSIQITAPGASGRNRLKYIDGLTIDRQPSNQTFLPESIVRTGGDLTFSLAGTPNKVWGTAASAAPPSFGAGSSAVTVNIARPIIGIVPGATGTVTVDAQRMIDGVDDYTVTPTSYVVGIAAEPLSGQFDDDGAVSASVAITVARSVPSGYYPIYVTTSAGDSARTLIVLVVVAEAVE